MNQNKPRTVDSVLAHSLAFMSGLAQHAPTARDRVMGFDGANYVPVEWKYTGQHVDSIGSWAHFPEAPDSGSVPRGYKRVGVLALNTDSIDRLQDANEDCRLAVAYTLGTATMVGVLPQNGYFPYNRINRDKSERVVGMRIGPGALHATAGIITRQQKFLVPEQGVKAINHYPVFAKEIQSIPVV